MFAFIGQLVLAVLCVLVAIYAGRRLKKQKEKESEPKSIRSRDEESSEIWEKAPWKLIRVAFVFLALFFGASAVIGTSMIWVPQNHIATLKRVYGGKSLPPGQIVALDGELGP